MENKLEVLSIDKFMPNIVSEKDLETYNLGLRLAHGNLSQLASETARCMSLVRDKIYKQTGIFAYKVHDDWLQRTYLDRLN